MDSARVQGMLGENQQHTMRCLRRKTTKHGVISTKRGPWKKMRRNRDNVCKQPDKRRPLSTRVHGGGKKRGYGERRGVGVGGENVKGAVKGLRGMGAVSASQRRES